MPNFWWFTKKLLVERSSHERLRSHLERRTVKAAASHRPGSAHCQRSNDLTEEA
jgi:hypothetical protein